MDTLNSMGRKDKCSLGVAGWEGGEGGSGEGM